jgi:hydroxyacylglutathione hydrolase
MALVFERIHTEGIAQLSYLLGDTSTGKAAVIDPRPDCDVYLQLARSHHVAITDILETHIHADFMSGSRELSRRLGNTPIHVSHAGAHGTALKPNRSRTARRLISAALC